VRANPGSHRLGIIYHSLLQTNSISRHFEPVETLKAMVRARPRRFSGLDILRRRFLYGAFLYGRAEPLTSKTCGVRPGQVTSLTYAKINTIH
jgi:hypothetical protein